jgi:c-di-GMP-binding flagellar brake protein YcgR
MLASLKRAFQRDHQAGNGRLSSADRIKALLKQLNHDHEILCATVPGCPQTANTAILGVQAKRGIFYLDELSSADVHRALLKSGRLELECRLRGMQLRFTARLLRTASENGLALYEMTLPSEMRRRQRRDHFRLRLSPGPTVPISIPNLEGESVKGEAFDLSASGIGAFLHTRIIPRRGQMLAGVMLSLPGTSPITAQLEIRFARQNTTQHMLRIGARFVALERKQERQIAQFLAEQQRKRRRHEPR